jgi:hypothetical protein
VKPGSTYRIYGVPNSSLKIPYVRAKVKNNSFDVETFQKFRLQDEEIDKN